MSNYKIFADKSIFNILVKCDTLYCDHYKDTIYIKPTNFLTKQHDIYEIFENIILRPYDYCKSVIVWLFECLCKTNWFNPMEIVFDKPFIYFLCDFGMVDILNVIYDSDILHKYVNNTKITIDENLISFVNDENSILNFYEHYIRNYKFKYINYFNINNDSFENYQQKIFFSIGYTCDEFMLFGEDDHNIELCEISPFNTIEIVKNIIKEVFEIINKINEKIEINWHYNNITI